MTRILPRTLPVNPENFALRGVISDFYPWGRGNVPGDPQKSFIGDLNKNSCYG